MVDMLDMSNRDPNNMNNHVQVMFDDILAEPEGAHSAECVWRNAFRCFNGGFGCCYKFITYFCGLPISLMWGCYFACITFNEVWCITPIIRVLYIVLHSYRKIQTIVLSAIVAPWMEAFGMFFSRIHVTNSHGEPPQPFGSMDRQDKMSPTTTINVSKRIK